MNVLILLATLPLVLTISSEQQPGFEKSLASQNSKIPNSAVSSFATENFQKCATQQNNSTWPWHAAIYFLPDDVEWHFKCSGTLIAENAVLTAAHCITKQSSAEKLHPDDLKVIVGKRIKDFEIIDPEQQVKDVERIVKHAYYNDYNLDSDIAIVVLKESVTLTDNIRPICLELSEDKSKMFAGENGYLISWGYKSPMNSGLRSYEIPAVDDETCRKAHPTFAVLVRPTTFCAGFRSGLFPCDGESGSSWVTQDGHDGSYQLKGILSTGVAEGTGGCNTDYYTVFTKVQNYAGWIKNVLDDASPN